MIVIFVYSFLIWAQRPVVSIEEGYGYPSGGEERRDCECSNVVMFRSFVQFVVLTYSFCGISAVGISFEELNFDVFLQ